MDQGLALKRTAQWAQGIACGKPSHSHGDSKVKAERDTLRAAPLARPPVVTKESNHGEEGDADGKQPNKRARTTITRVEVGPVVNLGEMTLLDSDDEMEDVKHAVKAERVVQGAGNEIRDVKGKGRELAREPLEDPELFLSRCKLDKQFIVHIDSITLSTTLPASSTDPPTRRPGSLSTKSIGVGIVLTSPEPSDPQNQKPHFRVFQSVDCKTACASQYADDIPGDAENSDDEDAGIVTLLPESTERSTFKMQLRSPTRLELDAQKVEDFAGLEIFIDIEDPDQESVTYRVSMPLVVQGRFQSSISGPTAFEHCFDHRLELYRTLQEGLGVSLRIEMSDVGRADKVVGAPVAREKGAASLGKGKLRERNHEVRKIVRTKQPDLERFLLKEDREPIDMPDLGPGRVPLHFDTMLPYAPGEKFFYPDDSKGRFSRLEVKLQRSGLGYEYTLIHRIHNHIIFSTPPSIPSFYAAKVGWKQYAKLIREHGAEKQLIDFLTETYEIHQRLEMLEEYLIGAGDVQDGEQLYGV